MSLPVCEYPIPPSGFTETPIKVFEWAQRETAVARAAVKGQQIKAFLWAYRHDRHEMLSLDIYDETDGAGHVIIFTVGHPHDFAAGEPYVPDMTEALHMAGIVIRSLGASIAAIGRYQNEVNPAVLAAPMKPGDTNGVMANALISRKEPC